MNTRVIDFYSDKIIAQEDEQGVWWIAIKSICDSIGLEHTSAYTRIKNDDFFSGVYAIQPIHDASNRVQEMLCLPFDHIHGWLLTINSAKVKDTVRAKLLFYKRECHKVLLDYFSGNGKKTTIDLENLYRIDQEIELVKMNVHSCKERLRDLEEEKRMILSGVYTRMDFQQKLSLDYKDN